jgi:TRAP-type C4-dicarboxylate transport system permease small subunit
VGPEPPVAQAVRRLDDELGRLEIAVVGLALLLLVGVGLYQSIAAHLFDKNDPWPYEVIRYSVFFVAMAGAALASQRSRLINLDVITRMLSPRNRAVLRIGTSLVALGTCVLLFKGGLDVRNLPAQQAVEYDIIPAPMALLALPLGALLVGVHLLLHALIDVSYLVNGQVAPETEQKVH